MLLSIAMHNKPEQLKEALIHLNQLWTISSSFMEYQRNPGKLNI